MSDDVLSRLRAATSPAHERLERRIGIFDAIVEPHGRAQLARRFFDFHASAEAALAPRLSALDGLEFERRRRSPHISDDLARIGAPAGQAAVASPPSPASTAEALGFLYVLEGSSLGGRVIRRQAERRGLSLEGLGFLDPYGPAAGEMWRRFLAVLSAHCVDAAAAADAARGAVGGFAHAEATLCSAELVA